jgi:D-proline reductase (dithiol) PrdB
MVDSEALQRSRNIVREKYDPHFEWVVNETAPWTQLRQPISQTAIALISTCGAYRPGQDYPFDAANNYGDPSYKEIPRNTPLADLAFAHTHYNHEHVDADPNVAFPLSHLIQLEKEKVIGRFVDPAISFTGFIPEPRQLVYETAPAAGRCLLGAGTQAALLVPC